MQDCGCVPPLMVTVRLVCMEFFNFICLEKGLTYVKAI